MALTRTDPLQTLRGEIENVLKRRARCPERKEKVATAWTAAAVAKETGMTERLAKALLGNLIRQGTVHTRTLKSGEVLYKLTDAVQWKWHMGNGIFRHNARREAPCSSR